MSHSAPAAVGIIGCGVISAAYLKTLPKFNAVSVTACADLDSAAAAARAAEFSIAAMTVDELLADPGIDIVLNLTTPAAHIAVNQAVLAAGKHAYSEKPLAVTVDEARPLLAAAAATGRRIGCAPDTFLGASHQTARQLIDDGAIGAPVAGTATMMVRGHERWHPGPEFYYQPGGGPMLDMGPYYITGLVNMLGPVITVQAAAKAALTERTIATGPRAGTVFPVQVPTHITGIVTFANGAMINVITSFDVWKHQHSPIEIYGTEGSIIMADPNRFDGTVRVCHHRDDWRDVPPTRPYGDGGQRGIGLADMAQAIASGRPHRASLELSFHVLEVMLGFTESAATGRPVAIESSCDRPAALPADLAPGDLGD